jgi:hypothetical protein
MIDVARMRAARRVSITPGVRARGGAFVAVSRKGEGARGDVPRIVMVTTKYAKKSN